MKTIKFRAWDEENKQMIQWHDTFFYDTSAVTNWSGDFSYIEMPLMQFTGLKDKKGKEIYEGDIIKYKHYYAIKKWWSNMNEIPEIEKRVQEQRDDYATEYQHVVFDHGGFYLGYNISGRDIDRGEKFERGTGHHSDYEEKYWDFEVVGNIYETPELLKG